MVYLGHRNTHNRERLFCSRFRCAKRLGHAFNGVFALLYEHDRYAWDLAYFAFEFLVARRHNVAAVLLTPLQQAVVCVSARMRAWQPFEPRILGQP